jgi:hypothetical protein
VAWALKNPITNEGVGSSSVLSSRTSEEVPVRRFLHLLVLSSNVAVPFVFHRFHFGSDLAKGPWSSFLLCPQPLLSWTPQPKVET